MDAFPGDARLHGRLSPYARLSRRGAPAQRVAVGSVRRVAGARSRDAAAQDSARAPLTQGMLGAREPPIRLHLAGAAARSDHRTSAREPLSVAPDAVVRAPRGVLSRREGHDSAALASESAGTRRAIVAVCAVAVLVAASAGGYIATRGSSPHRVPQPSPVAANTPVGQAEAWIKANLSRDAPLSAEASVAATLSEEGFPAHTFPAGGRWDADRFLVSTPAVRTDITLGLAASSARVSSVPLAVFGPAPGRVEVRMIVPGSASSLEARMARDAHDRLAAGRALLANPRVVADPGPRAVLRGGQLDLRAATVLALLATNAEVHVTGLALDQREAAVGRPVRRVTLSLRDTSALARTLRMLPHSYAPSDISAPVGGSRELTWSVGLAPPGLLS